MKNTIYVCDRCGYKQPTTPMLILKCEFGRPLNQTHSLSPIFTGHLCRECEATWCEKFFNPMMAFVKGSKA